MESKYFNPQQFYDDLIGVSSFEEFEDISIDFFTDLSKMLCIPVKTFKEQNNLMCEVMKEEFLMRLGIVTGMVEEEF